MTLSSYNYQNPSVCCFLAQIRAIVFLISAGLANLNKKAKMKWILVVKVAYSGLSSKGTSLCKWPIRLNYLCCLQQISSSVQFSSLTGAAPVQYGVTVMMAAESFVSMSAHTAPTYNKTNHSPFLRNSLFAGRPRCTLPLKSLTRIF